MKISYLYLWNKCKPVLLVEEQMIQPTEQAGGNGGTNGKPEGRAEFTTDLPNAATALLFSFAAVGSLAGSGVGGYFSQSEQIYTITVIGHRCCAEMVMSEMERNFPTRNGIACAQEA
jgi:hypothetical protein